MNDIPPVRSKRRPGTTSEWLALEYRLTFRLGLQMHHLLRAQSTGFHSAKPYVRRFTRSVWYTHHRLARVRRRIWESAR